MPFRRDAPLGRLFRIPITDFDRQNSLEKSTNDHGYGIDSGPSIPIGHSSVRSRLCGHALSEMLTGVRFS